jgi:hypothetical protein
MMNMKNKPSKATVESPMKRIGLAAGMLFALSTSACVEADATLLMRGPVLASCTDSETTGISCTFEGEDAPGLASVLSVNLGDLAVGQGPTFVPNIFTVPVSLKNRLLASDAYAPIGEQNNLRVDQNPIVIDSFQISFPSDSNLGGVDGLDSEYRYVVDVPSGDSSSGAAVRLVDATTIAAWKAVFGGLAGGNAAAIVPVLVNIQAFGTTLGGQEVESNIVGIPINVCLGCTYPSTPYGLLD